MTTSTYMTSNPGMKCIHYWYNKNLEHKESGQRERVLYFAIYLEENGLRTIVPPPLRFTGRQTTYNAATWNQVVLNFNVTAHSFKFIMDVIWQNIPPDDQLNSFSLDDFGYYDASCKDVEAEMRFSCSPWARSFHCLNGRCINEMDRCNDVDDCGDNSDELPVHAHCNAGLSAILQMVIGLTSVVLILMLMTGIFRSWQKGRCRRWIKHRRNSTTMTPDEPREILDPDTRVILRDKSKRKLEPEDVVELIPSHYPVPKKQSSAPPMRDSLVQTDESFPVNVSFIETHNAPSAETPPTTDQNNHHRGKHPFVRVNSRGVQVEEEFTLAGLDENLIKKVSRARKCQSFHDDSNHELTASKTSRNSIS
ncbi:uncharacterized protein LOC141915134 [Tubulanus polymorphus]|uniref:uncharacterized protein LOC141915134 n=1 Tax=Tubulanus polymorphus TaxID=672921 RepID=UPI003DA4DD5A